MGGQTLEQVGKSLTMETFKILLDKALSNLTTFEQAAGPESLQSYLPVKIILIDKAPTIYISTTSKVQEDRKN